MTLYRLELEPDDVSASALGYRVNTEPAPEALVTALLEHPQLSVALRLSILGASHAVTLVADGHDVVTEEVSCRPSTADSALPVGGESHPGPWGTHHLRGTVDTVSSVAFASLVEQLTTLASSGPEVLAGRFPGADGALTVVEPIAEPSGWSWRTWHLYPEVEPSVAGVGGEVVTTVSRLEVSLTEALTEVGA